MRKRFLITGNKGYIAKNLQHHILQNYHDPIIIGYDKDDTVEIQDEEFDCIFHLAATSNVDDCNSQVYTSLMNNLDSTIDLVNAIGTNAIGSRGIIFASSGAVYKPSDEPHIESDPFIEMNSDKNTYAASKVMCENIFVRARNEYGIKFVTLRLANVAGCSPYNIQEHISKDRTHVMPNLARAYRDKETFFVHGDQYQVRDYVHVDDVCRAFIQSYEAMKANASFFGAINISSGDGYSVKDIIDAFYAHHSNQPKIEYKQARGGDRPYLVLNNKAAKEFLGWEPQKSMYDIISDYIL